MSAHFVTVSTLLPSRRIIAVYFQHKISHQSASELSLQYTGAVQGPHVVKIECLIAHDINFKWRSRAIVLSVLAVEFMMICIAHLLDFDCVQATFHSTRG